MPGISGLLDRTGEFYRHTQRRYNDIAILIAEMCEWGYESGRGREALERMNWAHGHFRIANDDFLCVRSTFIYEPVRWIDRYCWRPTCLNEKLGYYPLSRPAVTAVMKLRGRLVRWLPPRRAPNFFSDRPNRTHPAGYRIADLGPPRLVARERGEGGERAAGSEAGGA